MSSKPNDPGAVDIIAQLPVLLGYTPTESVVVVAVRAGGVVGAVLRADRADCLMAEIAGPLARSIAGHLVRDRATCAIVVVFTSAEVRLACPAADALRREIEAVVPIRDVWAVRDGRYFAPGCALESCCPALGRAVPPMRGRALGDSVHVGARHTQLAHHPERRVEVTDDERRKAARAGQRWWAAREKDLLGWRKASLSLWTDAVRECTGSLEAFDEPTWRASASQWGRLAVALHDIRVRDAIILSWIPGQRRAVTGVLSGDGDDRVAAALASVLSPERGERPARRVADSAHALCDSLLAYERRHRRAPALSLKALMVWWDEGVQAALPVTERALAADPAYRLALLLNATASHGLQPGWLRAA